MTLSATARAVMRCSSESPCGACSQCDDERGPEPMDNEDAGGDEWPITLAENNAGPCAGCRACEGA